MFPTTRRSTLYTLYNAKPDEEFWYSFSSSRRGDQRVLSLTSVRDDPNGDALVQEVNRFEARCAALESRLAGVATVSAGGMFLFSGPIAAPRFLADMFAWLSASLDDTPALRRLLGARYVQLTDRGDVVSRTQNDAMWRSMLPEDVPLLIETQLNLTEAILRDLRPGDRLSFWFAPSAIHYNPLLILRKGTDAAHAARKLAREIGPIHKSAAGYVEIDREGRFHFFTPVRKNLLKRLAVMVSSNLTRHPTLGRLHNARQVVLDEDGNPTQAMEDVSLWSHTDAPQVEAHSAVLKALRQQLKSIAPGATYHFDFAEKGPTGAPLLVLTPTGEDSKRRHVAARKALIAGGRLLSQPCGGMVHVQANAPSRLHFQARRNAPDFLPTLRQFVDTNAHLEPSLNVLRQSTFSVTQPTH